jgi:glycosyltransferase involved in cell wall biosynthesis
MRILQLTPRLSWPPTDGGRVVMLQIARSLARAGATVSVLSLNPRKQFVNLVDARAALAPIAVDAIDIDTDRHIAALVRSFRIGTPQVVARFYSHRFAELLRRRLREEAFDIVQIESPFLLPYLPIIRACSQAVVVLRSINVEFRIWERLAANEPSWLRRLALSAVARGLRRYEIEHLDACDAIVPITAGDAESFRALGGSRPMHVLPGGVDVDAAPIERVHELANAVGFLGSLDYLPNVEAVQWLANELRPQLPASVKLHVAGSRAAESLRPYLESRGVIFLGDVPSARTFLESMGVVVAPIFSGGGMRIKILEALVMGKAVVATSIGAEGLDVVDGQHLVIANDARSFAAAIESLLREPSRAEQMGHEARTLVLRRYSADALATGLLAFYEQLTQRARIGERR